MEQKAVDILSSRGLMALATVRPDGWPQVTMVAYVNERLRSYFMVSRQSQKFLNIARDDRVSAAVGGQEGAAETVQGVSLAGHASEVTDAKQRDRLYGLLLERHPQFVCLPRPDFALSALLRVIPKLVSVIDFHGQLGHSEMLAVGSGDLTTMGRARVPDWGLGPAPPEKS